MLTLLLTLRWIGKSGFRILQSNTKSENKFYLREIRPQDRFSLRNPNPDFMDFLSNVRLGNPKKDLQNYIFSWTAVFFLLITRARARPLFLRTVFQILFRISQSNGKKEIQKHISQRWNPFSDFAFDNKSEMRILNSKSRFPNRKHPAYELLHFAIESSNTALTRRRLNRLKLLFTWYSWTPSYGHPVNTAIFL